MTVTAVGTDARLVGPALAVWAVTAIPNLHWYSWMFTVVIFAVAAAIGAGYSRYSRRAKSAGSAISSVSTRSLQVSNLYSLADTQEGSRPGSSPSLAAHVATLPQLLRALRIEMFPQSLRAPLSVSAAPSLAALALSVAAAGIAREIHAVFSEESLNFQQLCESWLSRADTPVGSWAATRRDELLRAVADFPPYARGLVPGVVVGDDSALPYESVDMMRMLGLSHVTAVSGAHVSLVFGIVIGVCGKRHPAVTAALAMASLYILIHLVGPQASVLRAGMMGVLMAVAIGLRRRASALPLVCIAVIAACLCFPRLATSLGFELSACTTAAIVLAGYPFSVRIGRFMPQFCAQALALPLVAGLASVPLVVGIQKESSVWTVLANVAVAPVIAPLTLCGLAAAVLVPAAAPVTHALLLICAGCAWWMAEVAEFFARMPGSHVSVEVAAGFNILLVLMLWGCGRSKRKRKAEHRESWLGTISGARALVARSLTAVTAFGAVAAVVAVMLWVTPIGTWIQSPLWLPFGAARIDPHWEIVQCDVGQGSALLARRRGSTVLIDTGSESGRVDQCLRNARVRHIDLLILSHFDADHVRGLERVLGEARVDAVWVSGNPHPMSNSSWVRALCARAGVGMRVVTAGESYGGWLWVESPANPLAHESTANDDSLVVRLRTQHYSVLALADVSAEIQDSLARDEKPADIVIVAHHGAASQSRRLAAALTPQVALFSVGENSYGHPTERAMHVWDAPIVANTRICGWISVTPAGVSSQHTCKLTGS